MPSISNVDILPSYRSDHSMVVLYFHINEMCKGNVFGSLIIVY